jgi:tetratricopeptide (TPR) repeat protein
MARTVDTSKLFQRASEAVEKGNYDYAVALFFDILNLNPDDVKTRMSLRSAQKSKFDNEKHGKGLPILAGLLGWPLLVVALLASVFKKYDAAIANYEKYLVRYPLSPHVLRAEASAFQNSGREELAIVTLEFLRQNWPTDVHALRELAHIYERRNDIARATQRYQAISQLRPEDAEAGKKIHDLAAKESIQESWDSSDTFQEKLRDREKTAKLEQGQKLVRSGDDATDAVARVKRDIEQSPDRSILWAELGDLQRRRGDYAESIEAYNKALELDPMNQLYRQKLMDARVQEFDARIEEAKKAAAAAPGDAALQKALADLEKQRQDFWLAELRRRVDERPTETTLRFDLAELYFELGKINEATAEFQRVVRDPKYKIKSTAMLGKCFAAKGLDDLAIGQFSRALQESSLMEEFGKDIAYNLGVLYEKVGNFAAAEETYRKLFETEIGYRDISEKMERVYKLRRDKNLAKPEGSQ